MSSTQPIHSALAALDRAPVWLDSRGRRAARACGLRGHVDVLVCQLAADPAVPPAVGRDVRGLPASSWWACTRRSSGSSPTLTTCARAAAELGVGCPVVIDHDFAIWRSFDNRYWRAIHLVDRDGASASTTSARTRTRRPSEPSRSCWASTRRWVRGDAGGIAEPANPATPRSPETYPGYARGERGSDGSADGLALNQWALAGTWSVGEEAAGLEAGGGSLGYRLQVRDLNLVLAPPASGAPVGFALKLDGQPPATTTASTSTSRATVRSPSPGCTS